MGSDHTSAPPASAGNSGPELAVNWYYELSDAQALREFCEYNRQRKASNFFMFTLFFVTCGLWPMSLYNICFLASKDQLGEVVVQLVLSVLVVLQVSAIMTVGWMLYFQHSPESLELLSPLWAWLRRQRSSLSLSLSQRRSSASISQQSQAAVSVRSSRSQRPWIDAHPSMRSVHHGNHTHTASNKPIRSKKVAPDHHAKMPRVPRSVPQNTTATTNYNNTNNHSKSCTFWCACLSGDLSTLLNPAFVALTQSLYLIYFVRNCIAFQCHAGEAYAPSKMVFFMQHHAYIVPAPLSLCEYPDFYVIFHSFLLLILPVLYLAALPDTPMVAVWSALGVTLCAIVGVAWRLSARDCWLVLLTYLCAVVLLAIDVQLDRIKKYAMNRQLRTILDENERNAEANHVMEMRHMIANVAHDLKTPLASFMTGVDFIELSLRDCQTATDSLALTNHTDSNNADNVALTASQITHTLHSQFDNITSSLSNIRSTHSFMLMTINRCIDYTKASKGLRLVPKYETIDLREAVELPLSCMRNFQSKVSIVLQPWRETGRDFSEEGEESVRESESEGGAICSHIITDKQWLQENLLCLLSNAVKYSQEGPVEISVSLEKFVVDEEDEEEKEEREDQKRKRKRDSPSMMMRMLKGSKSNKVGVNKNNTNNQNNTKSFRNNKSGQVSVSLSGMMSPTERDEDSEREHCADASDLESATHKEEMEEEEREREKSELLLSHTDTRSRSHSVSHSPRHATHSQREKKKSPSHKHARTQSDDERRAALQAALPWKLFVRFEVQDKGIGLTDEQMASLFNPFKQTQRLAGGTGLGLYSLAKRLEALQGFYGVQRRRDGQEGSLFWLAIPYKPDRSSQSLSLTPSPSAADCASPSSLSVMSPAAHTAAVSVAESCASVSYSPALRFSCEDSASIANTHAATAGLAAKEDENITTEEHLVKSATLPQISIQHALAQSQQTQAQNNSHTLSQTNSRAHSLPHTLPHTLSASAKVDPSLTILLVDDSPTITKMMSLTLRRLGHEVLTAENGAQAVKAVRSRWDDDCTTFDVVLMDLQMPVMDGLEATRRIRLLEEMSEGEDLPVVCKPRQWIVGMSANSDDETTQAAFQAGVDSFLPKPFNAETIRALLLTRAQYM